jgi:hypothetical protein
MLTARQRTLRALTALIIFIELVVVVMAVAHAADPRTPRDPERMKAEADRAQAELRRKLRLPPKGVDLSTVRGGTPSKPGAAPPFNASMASPPEQCLKSYINAAKHASSLEQIMPYLPTGEQSATRALLSTSDPKSRAKDIAWELNFHKKLASEILEILSVKIKGDRAELRVSTTSGATINGKYLPYGKADVEMVGEGNTWKFDRYSPSILYYSEPPTTP